MANILVSLCEI